MRWDVMVAAAEAHGVQGWECIGQVEMGTRMKMVMRMVREDEDEEEKGEEEEQEEEEEEEKEEEKGGHLKLLKRAVVLGG